MQTKLKRLFNLKNSYLPDSPYISYFVLAACVAVFILEIPYLGPLVNPIVTNFGVTRRLVFEDGQFYRLITAGFVHLSWMHILMNGYSLYMLGPRIESKLGHFKYAILLFVAILGGNLFVCFLAPNSLAVGLSTGLYGLMVFDIASLAMEYGWDEVWNDSGIRYTILINLLLNFTPGISWQGHLGGAIVGIVFAMVMIKKGK